MKQYTTIIGIAIVIGLAVWVVTAEVAKAPVEPTPTGITATTTAAATTTTDGNHGGGVLPYNSGVRGTVSLGPTCPGPVQRISPDPQCADRPYATTIIVHRVGSSSTFATGKSDATGVFKFSIPPGSYTLTAGAGRMFPRCSPADVTVIETGYATSNISCDTGIR